MTDIPAVPTDGQPAADSGDRKQFEAITSQESLDRIIGQRLGREKLAHEKQLADLQAKLDAATTAPVDNSATGSDPTAQAVADLQAKLDAEIAARAAAEQKAEDERVAALRTRLGKGLPDEVAALLTGTTEDEIAAQVAALTPHFTSATPQPNPQQGNPSQSRGGSLSAGRERYAANHK